MKKLAISCFCILSIPSPTFAGIQDIRSMNQNSNGSFNITCLNGVSETSNAESIARNLVCRTSNSSSSQRKSVVCTGNEFHDWFYVTRITDNKQFGDFAEKLSLNACQQAVRASSSQVVCTGNEFHDWFYLTRISDGKKFGDRLSFKTCLRLSNTRQ
jgi:hypothetical protein